MKTPYGFHNKVSPSQSIEFPLENLIFKSLKQLCETWYFNFDTTLPVWQKFIRQHAKLIFDWIDLQWDWIYDEDTWDSAPPAPNIEWLPIMELSDQSQLYAPSKLSIHVSDDDIEENDDDDNEENYDDDDDDDDMEEDDVENVLEWWKL